MDFIKKIDTVNTLNVMVNVACTCVLHNKIAAEHPEYSEKKLDSFRVMSWNAVEYKNDPGKNFITVYFEEEGKKGFDSRKFAPAEIEKYVPAWNFGVVLAERDDFAFAD